RTAIQIMAHRSLSTSPAARGRAPPVSRGCESPAVRAHRTRGARPWPRARGRWARRRRRPPTTPRAPTRADRGSAGAVSAREGELQLDLVLALAPEVADDAPVGAPDEDHATPMDDAAAGQLDVRAVMALRAVEIRRRPPVEEPRLRPRRPAERSGRRRLGRAVHHHRAVRGRRAEIAAAHEIAGVAVGTGVDEIGLAEDRALHAQEIGVAVPA